MKIPKFSITTIFRIFFVFNQMQIIPYYHNPHDMNALICGVNTVYIYAHSKVLGLIPTRFVNIKGLAGCLKVFFTRHACVVRARAFDLEVVFEHTSSDHLDIYMSSSVRVRATVVSAI